MSHIFSPEFLVDLLALVILNFLAFAILLPTKVGDKFLTYAFDRKMAAFNAKANADLEGLKSEYLKDLEYLRGALAHTSDRGKHSNEREYAALSAAWEAFVEAFLDTAACVVGFRQYPELSKLNSQQLEQFLTTSNFNEMQKDSVREADDKNAAFSRISRGREIGKAADSIFDARLVLRKQGLFIPKEIRDIYADKLSFFNGVYAEQWVGNNRESPLKQEQSKALLESPEVFFEEVLLVTQQRLMNETPIPARVSI